jgi:hypothetical protein
VVEQWGRKGASTHHQLLLQLALRLHGHNLQAAQAATQPALRRTKKLHGKQHSTNTHTCARKGAATPATCLAKRVLQDVLPPDGQLEVVGAVPKHAPAYRLQAHLSHGLEAKNLRQGCEQGREGEREVLLTHRPHALARTHTMHTARTHSKRGCSAPVTWRTRLGCTGGRKRKTQPGRTPRCCSHTRHSASIMQSRNSSRPCNTAHSSIHWEGGGGGKGVPAQCGRRAEGCEVLRAETWAGESACARTR